MATKQCSNQFGREPDGGIGKAIPCPYLSRDTKSPIARCRWQAGRFFDLGLPPTNTLATVGVSACSFVKGSIRIRGYLEVHMPSGARIQAGGCVTNAGIHMLALKGWGV